MQKARELEAMFVQKHSSVQLPVGSRLVAQGFHSDSGTRELMACRRKAAHALRLALERESRESERRGNDRIDLLPSSMMSPPTPPPPPTKCVSAATANLNALETHPCVNYLERQNRHGKGHQITPENHFLASISPKYPPLAMNTGREPYALVPGKQGHISAAIQRPFIIGDAYVQERQACGGGMLEYNDPIRDRHAHCPHVVRFHLTAAGTDTQREVPPPSSHTAATAPPFFAATPTTSGGRTGMEDRHRIKEETRDSRFPRNSHPLSQKYSLQKGKRNAEEDEKEMDSSEAHHIDRLIVEEAKRYSESEDMDDYSTPSHTPVICGCPYCFPNEEDKGIGIQTAESVPQNSFGGKTSITTSGASDNASTHSGGRRSQQGVRECNEGGNGTVWCQLSPPRPLPAFSSSQLLPCPFGCCCNAEKASTATTLRSQHATRSSTRTQKSRNGSDATGVKEQHQRHMNPSEWSEEYPSRSISTGISAISVTPLPLAPFPHRSSTSCGSVGHRSRTAGNTPATLPTTACLVTLENLSNKEEGCSTTSTNTQPNLGGRHPLFRHAEDVVFLPPRYAHPKTHVGEEYKDTVVPSEKWILSYTPSAKPWKVPPFLGRCGYKDKSLTFGVVQAQPSSALYPTPTEQYSSVAHCPLATPCDQAVPRKGIRRYHHIPK